MTLPGPPPSRGSRSPLTAAAHGRVGACSPGQPSEVTCRTIICPVPDEDPVAVFPAFGSLARREGRRRFVEQRQGTVHDDGPEVVRASPIARRWSVPELVREQRCGLRTGDPVSRAEPALGTSAEDATVGEGADGAVVDRGDVAER